MAPQDDGITFRPARAGDGEACFAITHASIAALGNTHYTEEQIAGWMGERTPAYYEAMIRDGNAVVAERDGTVVGFVDAIPGEVTRLFLLKDAAGAGLGRRLLNIGVETARKGHDGPVILESTLNAVPFYERNGFRVTGTGTFSHGLGGGPISIVHMTLD